MSRLLWRASRRHLTRHPWQLALSVLGVALGVAVAVAVDVAGDSARRAFELASEAVTGRATHRLTAGSAGIDEDLYRRLRVEHGLRSSAPVVEGWVELAGPPRRGLRLLGVDPFAEPPFRSWAIAAEGPGGAELDVGRLLTEPGAVLLSAETAAELGLAPGGTFKLAAEGRRHVVRLGGVVEPAGGPARQAARDLLLADLATAQELLDVAGRLTQIDLIVPPGARGEELLSRLRGLLPAGVGVERSAARTESAEQLTSAFRLNLRALSLLALLCGAFLIYNTMTFAVVQRRPLLGTLRALGTTRRQLFGLVLGEAAAIGGVGSALGLATGVALGDGLVGLVTRTINDLYFVVEVRRLELAPLTLLRGGFMGLGATLLAALPPAAEATATAPRQALARADLEALAHRLVPRATVAGGLAVAGGGVLLALPGETLAASLAAMFALLLGCALLTPIATLGLMRLCGVPAAALAGLLGRMATRGVVAALSRTGPAIAALTMAVSVTVGVDLMVRSFRSTVERWLDYSLPADLYLTLYDTPAGRFAVAGGGLGPETVDAVRRLPGVEGVNTLRHVRLGGSAETATPALAIELDPRARSAFGFARGDPVELWPRFERGELLLVSEPLAYRRRLVPGSLLRLDTPTGELELPVGGVFYDYASEQGLVLLPRGLYARRWNDPTVTAVSVHAAAGVDLDRLAVELRRAVGEDRRVLVRTTRGLREASLEVFDRTFLITGVLRLLAVVVAFVGVLSALMALQLERVRELGVLRACGLTPAQLWRLVTQQTGLMGLAAGLLALPVGLLTAAVLVLVVNRRSFGWSLELAVSPGTLLAAVGLAVGAALLAGLYPAFRMSRISPAEALRDE